ncbi:hypothetical protein [Arthrobacter sp. efr-133-R2A-63]|uniref:hypothetical protein n=1 Tax=Arthrobacter sp. efr-133-R2A-63 TaxID=3040278 RepID=UPI00254B3FE8|nr:hypothetical protein [Arthrobacter sp. efr-133-R2A-63]
MPAVATDPRLRIVVALIVIATAVTSFLMVLRPETEPLFRNIQSVMCGVLLVWAITILIGKTKGGRLVLTPRRWKYFTLLGVIAAAAIVFIVTAFIPARPGGNAALPLFPTIIGLFVAQLYEPEGSTQFAASDLSDHDAKAWKRIAVVSAPIGAALICIAVVAGIAGNIGILALLLPIGVLLLVTAAAIWTMLRTRSRKLRPNR